MLLQSLWCFAQENVISPDSTYHVDEIMVEGNAITKVSNDQKIDSAQVVLENAIGLGGLLKYNSMVFIKDYGSGNLTTVSARGGSASQSQVFWNGININQAGLGMTDLSTLPPFLLDNITVQQSASGAASGSGSMAGNILLTNQATGNTGFYSLLKQTFSSIGERSTGLRLGYNKNKLSADVRYFYLNSDNTYRFTNADARPYAQTQTQHNAGLLQQGYVQEIQRDRADRAHGSGQPVQPTARLLRRGRGVGQAVGDRQLLLCMGRRRKRQALEVSPAERHGIARLAVGRQP